MREALEAKQWAEARAQMLILRDILLAVAQQVVNTAEGTYQQRV